MSSGRDVDSDRRAAFHRATQAIGIENIDDAVTRVDQARFAESPQCSRNRLARHAKRLCNVRLPHGKRRPAAAPLYARDEKPSDALRHRQAKRAVEPVSRVDQPFGGLGEQAIAQIRPPVQQIAKLTV
nr:hypothetical protein [Caballeronia concitans]